jgi:four helix bundle protein
MTSGLAELVKNITRRAFAARHSNYLQSFDAGIPQSHGHLSAMAAGIRDLKVWQEAVALGAEIVRAARANARRETKVVTDQLMLTALAAAGAIADGYGRYTASEQRQLYRAAKRELLRLETQLAIARHADLLSVQVHADLANRVQSVSRLLGGYLVYLERQLTPEPGADRAAAR